jgi:hypothetical protein
MQAGERMKAETINGFRVKVYDNGGKTFDRYTVVFLDRKLWGYGPRQRQQGGMGRLLYPCLGMSSNPFAPNGFGQHSDAALGPHLGKRIPFSALPELSQKCAMRDLTPEEIVESHR